MAIGKETIENLFKLTKPKWRTSITHVEPNRIITRGYPQEDLIGNLSFPEMVYLLLKGEIPHQNHAKMLEAILVSFCDHGVTPPSTQVARIMASAGSPLNACVSGGILSFGKHHAGALERSMRLLQEVIKDGTVEEGADNDGNGFGHPPESCSDLKQAALDLVDSFLEKRKKIPGFGHRFHREDPRPPKLLKLARKYGCSGLHTKLVISIQEMLMERKGVRMNIDGASAGILSDMGFDWKFGTGIFMIGRLPALISHVHEEKTMETPFKKFLELEEIYYDGFDVETLEIDRSEL
jgi:citrate synthase